MDSDFTACDRPGLHSRALRLLFLLTALITMALAGCSREDEVATSVDVVQPETVEELSDKDNAVANLGIAPEYSGVLASLSLLNVRDAVLELVLPPIGYPWAFEFIGESEILLTQHNGDLSRFNLETGRRTLISGLPDIGQGYDQIGLMDVAIHPDFESNQRIYISFAKPHPEAPTYHMTEVATGILDGDQLKDVKTLLNSDNYGWAPSNFGGALAFDDNGNLYVTIGDRGEDLLSQRGDRLEGKVLRIAADGSVPPDNPFVDHPDYDPRVYAVGVRNSQGLHFDVVSGQLFSSDHGPLGGDEINIIKPGRNYGWPDIGYGANYNTALPMGKGTHRDDVEQPVFYFLPSIAVSPLVVYRGDMFAEWDGDILVGALRGEHVAKLDYDDGVVRSAKDILQEVGGRIRDIKVAEDGSIYILSQTSGLHRLFKPEFDPDQAASASQGSAAGASNTPQPIPSSIPVAHDDPDAPHPGKQYYDIICSGCHDTGALGAPVLGDYEAWQPIMAQPESVTIERLLNGYNDMPERGSCYFCSNFGLVQMTGYMFHEAQKNAKAQPD